MKLDGVDGFHVIDTPGKGMRGLYSKLARNRKEKLYECMGKETFGCKSHVSFPYSLCGRCKIKKSSKKHFDKNNHGKKPH